MIEFKISSISYQLRKQKYNNFMQNCINPCIHVPWGGKPQKRETNNLMASLIVLSKLALDMPCNPLLAGVKWN